MMCIGNHEGTSSDIVRKKGIDDGVDFCDFGVDLGDEVNALLDRLKKGEDILTVYHDFEKFRRNWDEKYIPMFAAKVDEEYDDLTEFLKDVYTLGLDWEDDDNLLLLLGAFVGLMWWKADRMTPNSFLRLNSCLCAIDDAFYKEVNTIKKEDNTNGNVR